MKTNEQDYRIKKVESELAKTQKQLWILEDEFAKTNKWVAELEKKIKRLEKSN